jgi:hypothetical protein
MRDVVVMVREGREYEELRLMLRSLANLPHGRVWVYGGAPRWLAGAVHCPIRQGAVSHVNTARITAAIANNRALSDEFYWFHDDMFVMEPCREIPRLWRTTWDNWAATAHERREPHGPAKTGATAEVLAAFGKPAKLCYELHVPMVMDREALCRMVAEVTAWRPEALAQVQKRSLYGNWVDYGGEQDQDVKFYRSTIVEQIGPFASSSDHALTSPVGQLVRERFPEPGRYEAVRASAGVSTADRLMAGHLAGKRM